MEIDEWNSLSQYEKAMQAHWGGFDSDDPSLTDISEYEKDLAEMKEQKQKSIQFYEQLRNKAGAVE